MTKVRINEALCKGCKICVEFCPLKILKPSKNLTARGFSYPVLIDEAKCTCCGVCEFYCPDFAIYLVRRN